MIGRVRPIPSWTLWLFATLPFLGTWTYGLFDLDEGFYGSVVTEMVRRGEWITPYYNGTPWFEKPILLYWLAKPSVMLFGEVVGLRLPSILASLGTCALVYWFAKRHFNLLSAQLAVLILATSLLFVGAGRMALTDPLLTLATTAAFLTFFESLVGDPRWRLVSAACLGASVLAKGPVGIVLFLATVVVALAMLRPLRPAFRGYWLLGTLLFAAVVALWYVPAYVANGEMFVQKFLIEQNIQRFTGGDTAHPGFGGILFYPLVLLLGMLPWSAWIPVAWPRARRDRDEAGQALVFLSIAATVIVLFFSISAAKLPHYALPATPLLAIIVADWLQRRRPSVKQTQPISPQALCLGCIAMFAFANGLAWGYYNGRFGGAPQAEIHGYARWLRANRNGAPVAVYQMSRRQAALGTGGVKLMETSLPSVPVYLGDVVIETDSLAALSWLRASAFILTRAGRLATQDVQAMASQGLELRQIPSTITGIPSDHFQLWELERLSP